MDDLDRVLMQMDLQFVGNARHKITVAALFADRNALLLDVRTHEEAASLGLNFPYHLHSKNLPLHCLPAEFESISRDCRVGIFCPHAVRAAVAYTFLRSKGYERVYVLDGGYAALVEEARPGRILAALNTATAMD